jgi:hypothetical protein
MLGCGFLSSRGNFWERFTMALAFGWLGSMIATAGIALVYYVKIRSNLGRLVRHRRPLTDKDFTSLSPQLKGVDPFVVRLVRRTAAKEFRSIGGERFQPGDDLEADLHLSDLSFWGEWLEGLARDLGIEEDELAQGMESVTVESYGDLVLLFDRLARRSKGAKTPIDHVSSNLVWDRELDE